MSKFKLSLLLVILAAIGVPALADDAVVKRVPAGAVAFHFVLDLTYVPGPPELVGYMSFIEGVDTPIFAGVPSKNTAYFTLRVTGGAQAPLPMPGPAAIRWEISRSKRTLTGHSDWPARPI